MDIQNGWFQLETHNPVTKAKPEKKGASALRPPAGNSVPEDKNPISHQHTYEQRPISDYPANRMPQYNDVDNRIPVSNDPLISEHESISVTQMPDMMDNTDAAAARHGHGWEQKAAPVPNAMQQIPANWTDEMSLSTRHSQTVGARGPVLIQDNTLHEALGIFINKKIPERPVHTKGYGALGTFQTLNSMRGFTSLPFLQSPGQQVSVMVRYSFAVSNKGTPDTARNVRGFSTKFYTREGVFDLLCNHIPVLFVRDGIRFPEAITSLMPSPVNNLPDPEQFWIFVARAPEAIHFVTWLYSDVGTVKSFRHMQGHSVNTYVWKNAQGARRYVKYHWLPLAGVEYIDRQEATELAGINPDIAGQDLYDTIASGRPVQYELCVQLMDPQDEAGLPYDPLDCTKVWDEQQYPLITVGRLTLNRNPENFMEQIEKVAFSPSNLLDGAELSDDKLLQARANIYWDSQRRRLGEDFRSIPVNAQSDWTPDDLVTTGEHTFAEGQLVRSELPDPDNFSQAGQRYMSLTPNAQDHLVDNLAADLALVSPGVRSVVLSYLSAASTELGQRVYAQISYYTSR